MKCFICYIIMNCEVRLRETTIEIFVYFLTKPNKLQTQCLHGRAVKNTLRPKQCFIVLNTNTDKSGYLTLILLMWRIGWALIVVQYTRISNKIQCYTVYFYLETALHVSGGTSTQRQERIQLYLQHLVFVTTLLLSAAIVEELELVWVA
jgi:hypothetical protein